MLKEMKLQDLMSGDIVVDRDGEVGIVIVEKEIMIYQNGGLDDYVDFKDDLMRHDDYRGGDIMAVYRDEEKAINFSDYNLDYEPIYERHDNIEWSIEAYWEEQNRLWEEKKKNRPPACYGVIQAFYGNRTQVEFTETTVDQLIMGSPGDSFWEAYKKVDRSMIPIPGEEGLVLLYNKYQEEEKLVQKEEWYQEDGYVMKPLAEIPELNVKLYSRCLACRVDEENKVTGLREEDYEKVMKYLAK